MTQIILIWPVDLLPLPSSNSNDWFHHHCVLSFCTNGWQVLVCCVCVFVPPVLSHLWTVAVSSSDKIIYSGVHILLSLASVASVKSPLVPVMDAVWNLKWMSGRLHRIGKAPPTHFWGCFGCVTLCDRNMGICDLIFMFSHVELVNFSSPSGGLPESDRFDWVS